MERKIDVDKDKEVFRLMSIIGKHYEQAECTWKEGKWPSEKYYAPSTKIIYLGTLIRIDEDGAGDGSWRTDTFWS